MLDLIFRVPVHYVHVMVLSDGAILIYCCVGWVTDYIEYNVQKSQESDDSEDDMEITDEGPLSESRAPAEKT